MGIFDNPQAQAPAATTPSQAPAASGPVWALDVNGQPAQLATGLPAGWGMSLTGQPVQLAQSAHVAAPVMAPMGAPMGAPMTGDLNADAICNTTDGPPFFPFGQGGYTVRIKSFRSHSGFKGRAYHAVVTVLTSSRPDDVPTGMDRTIRFAMDGTPEQVQMRQQDLRKFLAAIGRRDPADKTFDANYALKVALDSGENWPDLQIRIEASEGTSRAGKPVTRFRYIPINQ